MDLQEFSQNLNKAIEFEKKLTLSLICIKVRKT